MKFFQLLVLSVTLIIFSCSDGKTSGIDKTVQSCDESLGVCKLLSSAKSLVPDAEGFEAKYYFNKENLAKAQVTYSIEMRTYDKSYYYADGKLILLKESVQTGDGEVNNRYYFSGSDLISAVDQDFKMV